MEKYYVVGHNDEYLSSVVYAEGTDREALQTVFYDAIRKELASDFGMTSEDADSLIEKSLSSLEDVDPRLSVNGAASATIRYGAGYETCIDVLEKTVPSYHIEELNYGDDPEITLTIDAMLDFMGKHRNTIFESQNHAEVTAKLVAYEAAQALNERTAPDAKKVKPLLYHVVDEIESGYYTVKLVFAIGQDTRVVRKFRVVEDT